MHPGQTDKDDQNLIDTGHVELLSLMALVLVLGSAGIIHQMFPVYILQGEVSHELLLSFLLCYIFS